MWTPGYRLLLRWCTKDTPEDKAPQPVAAVMAGKNTEVARVFCSLNKMEGEDGLPPNQTKTDATQWGCGVAWDHLKDAVQPPLRHRPPMAVKGAPGDTLEVAMDLHVVQVRSAVRNSAKCPGEE